VFPVLQILARAALPLVAVLVALSVAPVAPFAALENDARACCEGEAEEAPTGGDDCCPEGDCGTCHLSCCGHFVVLGGPRSGPQGWGDSTPAPAGPVAVRPRPAPRAGIDRPPRA